MATRLIGTDSADPVLPASVIAASVGTTAGTLTAGDDDRLNPGAPLHDTYTDKPDGAPPATADTGQTWSTGVGATPAISGGRLVNPMADPGAVPVYRDTNMGAKVTRVGARFVFPTGATGTSGAVGILSWATSVATAPFPPDSPFHAAIDSVKASFSVWESQVYEITPLLLNHTYAAPLVCDGTTVYEAEAVIEGDTVTFRLPDGSIHIVTDPRIASLGGDFAGFEITDGDAGAAFRPEIIEVWADAEPITSFNKTPLGALYRAAASVPTWTLFSEYTTAGTTGGVLIPATTIEAEILVCGGGAGGGSGRRGAAASVRCGGGGGSGGSYLRQLIRGAALDEVWTVIVGAGGAGGAAVTADDTSGNAGTVGTLSSVTAATSGLLCNSYPGNVGAGGTATAGAGGVGVHGMDVLNAAGSASATGAGGGTGSNTGMVPTGAGAGGGITTGNAAAAGGYSGVVNSRAALGLRGEIDNAGGAGSAPTATQRKCGIGMGTGGGGGGSSLTIAGGTGGVGAAPGGGGGGGGASVNGQNSGAGGAGGVGYVAIWVLVP